MGTRADFYIGRGKDARWLGSIAWDGDPRNMRFLGATTENEFMLSIVALSLRKDWTKPEDGWPWPWKDSGATDFAYAWDDGVHIAAYGCGWYTPDRYLGLDREEMPPVWDFPDMTSVQNVTFGPRSGILLLKG
jgi:hypothetical protein